MTRDEFVNDVAALIAGLQVPVSLGMPLGAATEPWRRLKNATVAVGWSDADEVAEGIRRILEEVPA